MKLSTLYRMAQQFDAQCGELYHKSDWTGFTGMIAARDKAIGDIVIHPKNKLNRMQVMCRVISGMSMRD